MRDGALPAAIIAAAVVAFVGYLSFQGSSHAVAYAVTGSDLSVRAADHPSLPKPWSRRARGGHVMLVDVSWAASEPIGAGSYALLTTTPPRWRPLGCRPECEWSDEEGLREFARRLPVRPYPLAATFEAEAAGDVRVAFRSPRDGAGLPDSFVPVAWLVQTNGDDVLGAEQVPLTAPEDQEEAP